MRQRALKFSSVLKILTFLSIYNLKIQILVFLVYKLHSCKLWSKNNRSAGPTLTCISHAIYIANSNSYIYISDSMIRWWRSSPIVTPVSDCRCHSPMVKCLVDTKARWSLKSLNVLNIRNVCDVTLCRRQNISNVHLQSSYNQIADIESHNQIRFNLWTILTFTRGETFCIFKHSILTSWLQRFNEPSDFSASQLQTISQTIGLRRDNRTIESHRTMKFYISM